MTPNPHKELLTDNEPWDNCSFNNFEHKIPTLKEKLNDQLVATSIMVVDKIHNHAPGKLLHILFVQEEIAPWCAEVPCREE